MSLRVPGGPANSRHIEHRICGADANPYLAAAAILAGIHRGIRENLDPGEPVQGNGYAQATQLLPTDWLTSLTALENSAWARDALGQEFLGFIWRSSVPSIGSSWAKWVSRTGAGI